MEGLHPHHVEYRSAGGEDELDNLVTLCAWCHAALHDGHLSIEVVGKNNFKFWRKL
jgi:predicted HNH restriction endonuclease